MRKLTDLECIAVSGGLDGVHLGGNMYVSTTTKILNRVGVFGVVSTAATGGYRAGSRVNEWLENNGGNAGDHLYNAIQAS